MPSHRHLGLRTLHCLAGLGAAVLWAAPLSSAQPLAPANPPILQQLQGAWQGVLTGQETAGKVSLTITGQVLHFQGLNTNEWYDTTFALPADTHPQQLHATIKRGPRSEDIGKTVTAILKIENDTLTLAGVEASAAEPLKTFGESKPSAAPFEVIPATPAPAPAFEGNSLFRYDLKRVAPPKQQTDATPLKRP